LSVGRHGASSILRAAATVAELSNPAEARSRSRLEALKDYLPETRI
jgi:hypothetical protein